MTTQSVVTAFGKGVVGPRARPTSRWLGVVLSASCLSACVPTTAATDLAAQHGGEPAVVDGSRLTRPKFHVLVTGFHDWRDLGEPPDVWRCRDNPSCRLLLGAPTSGKEPGEADFDGPLVQRLKARAGEDVVYHFDTMPVTWGAYDTLGDVRRYEAVVHLGLGVYDTQDAIQVEHGAFNLRRGTDAAGESREEPVVASRPPRVDANADVEARISTIAGKQFGSYLTRVAEAREDNTYLCNETHFRALEALASDDGPNSLDAAFFVHIPTARADDPDHEALAEGVAGVVQALVE